MPETIYVGLDLGSSRCQQTIMGADGMVRFSRVIPTSERSVRLALDNLGSDVRVHMEAGELAVWMCSVISPLVSQLVVSHPRSLAWIGKDSIKSDRISFNSRIELNNLETPSGDDQRLALPQ